MGPFACIRSAPIPVALPQQRSLIRTSYGSPSPSVRLPKGSRKQINFPELSNARSRRKKLRSLNSLLTQRLSLPLTQSLPFERENARLTEYLLLCNRPGRCDGRLSDRAWQIDRPLLRLPRALAEGILVGSVVSAMARILSYVRRIRPLLTTSPNQIALMWAFRGTIAAGVPLLCLPALGFGLASHFVAIGALHTSMVDVGGSYRRSLWV